MQKKHPAVTEFREKIVILYKKAFALIAQLVEISNIVHFHENKTCHCCINIDKYQVLCYYFIYINTHKERAEKNAALFCKIIQI